ncbi:hypothetical protein HTZ63_002894, partial [Enterococcus faecalis]|nr:hypothetical protein [Enterococcus faecalis]
MSTSIQAFADEVIQNDTVIDKGIQVNTESTNTTISDSAIQNISSEIKENSSINNSDKIDDSSSPSNISNDVPLDENFDEKNYSVSIENSKDNDESENISAKQRESESKLTEVNVTEKENNSDENTDVTSIDNTNSNDYTNNNKSILNDDLDQTNQFLSNTMDKEIAIEEIKDEVSNPKDKDV